jgi:predicted TIM-barrel fold metal-dependent hydrolase
MQTPWGDFPVADAHTHFFSRRLFQSLAAQCSRSLEQVMESLGWQLPPEDPAVLARTWAAELDRHGVARAALIASMPGDEASVLAAKAERPDRFWAYAMVNPAAENASITEGLDAVCFFPAMHRYAMHDARVQPLLDQAAAHGCAVFVHCGVLSVGVRKKLGLSSPFDMRFSNPIDLHPIALTYPQVRFVVPHFGAGFFREALMLADLCPNVYLDTSSSNSWIRYQELDLKTVFRRAMHVAGAGRLLFGTDSSFFPRGWVRDIFEQQTKVLSDLGIGASDARLIFGGNLEGLLKKQASSQTFS